MNYSTTGIRIGSYRLDPEKADEIHETINKFICVNKPFLRHGYSLKDLSDDLQIPLHHLSAFINQRYLVNFNEFINEYRVAHFINMIKTDEWKLKKLQAIAEESGFGNRNTFALAFRKIKGQNPSDFMKLFRKDYHEPAAV